MFTFQAWRPAAQIGDPDGVAASFSRVYTEHRPSGRDDAEIRFEIVDLRPGAYSAQQVHDLVKRLAKLLLGDAADAQSFSPTSRLLFVGSVRTLATREREADHERSIKRDAEFYIRALQNYDLAHYAGIGEDGVDGEGPGASILSALIGISRHYRDRERWPATLRLASRLARIRSDFVNLVTSARNLPEFQFLGSIDGPDFAADRVDHLALLLEIGTIYQFGKGDRPEAFSPDNALVELRGRGLSTFDVNVEDSSYKLYAGMLAKMGSWAEAFHAGAASRDEQSKVAFAERQSEAAGEVAKRSFKLSRYDLLRDFGRVIGQGTLQRLREIGPSRPILLIDDEVYGILAEQGGVRRALDDSGQDPIIRYLGHALGSVGRSPVSVHVVPSDYVDAHIGLMQATGLSRLLRSGDEVLALDLEGGRTDLCAGLDDYLAILIDPESRRDPCGPVRVQRLNGFLRHRFGPVPGVAPLKGMRQPLPPLLAYSRKESSGYVQQCLNMGASAFVPKTRPYQLLFALSRALRDERRQHRPGEHASQFRILKTLKPHVAAKLLRKSGPSFIYGGFARNSGSHVEDPREARWVRNLPKADLHYHLGTAIPCGTIEVLAMNTAGHFLSGAPDPSGTDSGDGGASPLLRRLAATLALTARLERRFLSDKAPASFSRMELLAAAAATVVPGKALKNSPFGLGDAIVGHLVETNDRCDPSHATAILVAMMVSRPGFGLESRSVDFFEKLIALSRVEGEQEKVLNSASDPVSFTPDRALIVEMERAFSHFNRVACRWSGTCTKDDFAALANAGRRRFWEQLRDMTAGRVERANARLRHCLDGALSQVASDDAAYKRALEWLAHHSQSQALRTPPELPGEAELPVPNLFSLEQYVAVPEVENGRGLQLYLRGADLLGSSHLQYPENLWIAALAITDDNARDNVIYSEVRCETTGFSKAGMGAHDATEQLRHGFNLASLYIAGLGKTDDPRHALPLVRTNILLAAKRHKTEGEARAVVNLLEAYLERRAAVADAARSRRDYSDRFGRTMPPWWRPCDVVGFDLSGDESRDKEWLKTVIVPLASRSSPVTIHAGEAASAESIWRAVYELNALRIGHGLRLNEDTALLGYCVREGICMEFCPNSNRYTNQLLPQERRDLASDQPVTPLRYEYPLLHYLSQGMEVTLGTDNRYLHRQGQRTLTSEYLTAAELVGGLTRWEVLQIVKAGFKNAFLDKAEVQSLIESAEEEIYRIVATDFE